MKRPFHRLVLLAAAMTCALPGVPCTARDSEPREIREVREPRETREVRDMRETREREAREVRDTRHDREDADRDDDRSGSNRGSDGNRERRSSRVDVERNARGGDRQRDEVLLIGPDTAVPAMRQAGYTLLSERRMESLRQTMVRVRVRDGQSVEQLIDLLRQLVPGARVAPNNIYNPSQPAAEVATGSSPNTPPARLQAASPMQIAEIGIIDTGADTSNPSLRPLLQATRGFAAGGYHARPHGTAVAQLAAAQGATITVADVFEVDKRNRLVAPAELIAAALDWMLSQHVRVVNISIEGPYNAVLDFVVQEAIARGTVVVAAAGNGGPSAAPAYPAASAGVIAVTALDERGQLYRRAARGNYVQFAARGSYAVGQELVATPEPLAGTSFAAPVVAAQIARLWRSRPDASRDTILAALRAEAIDMGAPGRDPIYGWGRIAPQPAAQPSVSAASLP